LKEKKRKKKNSSHAFYSLQSGGHGFWPFDEVTVDWFRKISVSCEKKKKLKVD